MQDLRSFLDLLRTRGELVDVHAPIDPVLESTALCQHVLDQDGPALLMHQPRGATIPMLGNLFGTRRRIEMVLSRRPLVSLRELGSLLAALKEPRWPGSLREAIQQWPELAQLGHVAPRTVTDVAFNERILDQGDVDLDQLPIQQCWPDDAGKLITFGLVVTRGPDQSRQNIAIYRMQVIGRNRVIMRWLAHRGGAHDFRAWCRAFPGQKFPVLVAIGADPATLLAAVAPIPDSISEFEFAGLIRGSRSRVWRSARTGLMAPAGAEMVLEGFIDPNETALEGPFGDHTGHYNEAGMFPVMTIECLRQRRDAIYHCSYMGRSPRDEPSVLASALNDVFVPILQKVFPEIMDFHLPAEACSYRLAVVSIRKQYAGHARRIMMAIWSYLRQFTYTKIVIVVDEDIDVRQWPDVIWAWSTRADPARDTLIIERSPVDYLDYASPDRGLGGKIGIDATRKWSGECTRATSPPIVPDASVVRRMQELWERVRAS